MAFPYEDAVFPPWTSTKTIGANLGELDQKRRNALTRTPSFRTTAGICRRQDKDFHDLHPDLPLIQIHGFCGQPGSSGSPVFTSRDGSLIGLIMLEHSGMNYVLPTNFIIAYIRENKIHVDGLMTSHKTKGKGVEGFRRL